MILDQSDPTGLGLFSRCARNQACKTTKTRPQTANSRKSMTSPQIHQNKRQKTIIEDMFSKQQSRQQRQRKYKRQHTPAVGQYNNIILKPKPKLVWDVVKLYHKKTKHVRELQQLKQRINNSSNNAKGERYYKSLDFDGADQLYMENNHHQGQYQSAISGFNNSNGNDAIIANHHNNNNNKNMIINMIITQPTTSTNHKHNNRNLLTTQSFMTNTNNKKQRNSFTTKNQYQSQQQSQQQHNLSPQSKNKRSKYANDNDEWPSGLKKKSIIKSKICMVDMSRTTGRQSHGGITIKTQYQNDNTNQQYNSTITENNNNNNTTNSQSNNLLKLNKLPTSYQSQQTIQLHKSLQKIKPRTKPNYYFKKMLGRKDDHNNMTAGNVYDCNIDIIKPKKSSALLDFGITKGRQDQSLNKTHNQKSGYSYTHYDYNDYVWKSTSSVFANTKKHLIPFDKQR